MNTPDKSVNAWIFLDEDEPSGSSYKSPDSCYQSLSRHGVYHATDILDICFFVTVPTGAKTVPPGDGSSYTIEIGNISMKHPDGSTNLQYLQWLIDDARKSRPGIKLLATLGYGSNELSNIFSNTARSEQQNAENFAANLLACLQQYDLDGFDVDWEFPLDTSITQGQFSVLFNAIHTRFNSQPARHYFLTLSPASVGNLDPATVNDCFDFLNLQLYSGFTDPSEFISRGIRKELLAYGAKFESIGNGNPAPFQDAQNACQGYVNGDYNALTQWRLNSGNFQFEQAQQIILYQLLNPSTDGRFDDTLAIGAAGNPPITGLVVRTGNVLDSIQATNTGEYSGVTLNYTLPQHGGNGGTETVIAIPPGDAITNISGYSGTWFGWQCVLQITLKTRQGKVLGPFGSMDHATSKTPFSTSVPPGQSIVAFSGTTVKVPQASGGSTEIIATLNATCSL